MPVLHFSFDASAIFDSSFRPKFHELRGGGGVTEKTPNCTVLYEIYLYQSILNYCLKIIKKTASFDVASPLS